MNFKNAKPVIILSLIHLDGERLLIPVNGKVLKMFYEDNIECHRESL
jgi:hypothetical protein